MLYINKCCTQTDFALTQILYRTRCCTETDAVHSKIQCIIRCKEIDADKFRRMQNVIINHAKILNKLEGKDHLKKQLLRTYR